MAGVLALLVVVLPVGAASHAWVSRLRPDWSGAVARLAEIVVGLASTLVVLEFVGSISLFRAAVVVPVLAVVGIVGWWAAARRPAGEVARAAPDEVPGFGTCLLTLHERRGRAGSRPGRRRLGHADR